MIATTRARRSRRLLVASLLLAAPLALISASSALTVSLTPVKADPTFNEYLPAASADWIAWTANSVAHPKKPNAFVQRAGHAKIRLNPGSTYGETGGFDGNTSVWTQWSDTSAGDIWRFNVTTGVRTKFGPAVNTRYGEYYPTLSGPWVLFTRYNWDDNLYRVILVNRNTSETRVLALGAPDHAVYAGQVNGNWATYARGGNSSGNVFRYDISTGVTFKLPNSAVFAYSPAVAADGTIFYIRSGDGCGVNVDLLRYPVAGPVEKVRDLPNAIDGWHLYVDDRADGSREVHFARVNCTRNTARALDTYKFADAYQLTVVATGDGTGTVTSDPGGINCGLDCTQVYPHGTTVTLTATPGPNTAITGWSVPECGVETQCVVDIDATKTVTVTFTAT